ncbi:flagellar biosynthesis protein FlhA [Solicola sp. PLA-1-18]|uniref:flagellar biosynthesis protein FlhA n=1 Tax=Solicola sp. PLA-1-18 TaxID=3380532 RepID=UPI003B803784
MRNKRLAKLGVPVGVVAIIVMLVVPLPPLLLDLLIAANITAGVLILMTAMSVRKPLEFSAFPAVLLIATLFRLALNISATRLVLLDGYAGKVIETFGHFVVGGSLIVGIIVFAILVVIQFVVITNGAGRVAEVGARFKLDAMPGKQMAIDADLNSGLIDEDEARRRRAEVSEEADFYGAMDGASKFVKGDAIAAVIITLVNLLGGFAVGVMQNGMSMGDAVQTYSLLTVGDGLVSQIPALLLSVATGLIVTRAASQDDMGTDIAAQLTRTSQPLRIAGFAAIALCVIPGMPKMPFLVVGAIFLFLGFRPTGESTPAEDALELEAPAREPDSIEALLEDIQVDPLELELSADLVDLVDSSVGGDLLARVKSLRRKVAEEIGVVVPPVRTRDNLDLPLRTYAIRLFGVEVARGTAPPGTVLAIGDNLAMLPGERTVEPVFGLDAVWIPAELRSQAEIAGATVVDRASVVTTHLADVVRRNAARLLGREETRMLSESLRRTHPTVVEELTPAQMTLGEVQRVLQRLLAEGVSIRDLARIFEALSLRASVSKDVDGLVLSAREALGPALLQPYAADGTVHVISFDPALEQQMLRSLHLNEDGGALALDPDVAHLVLTQLARFTHDAEQADRTPVLACAPQLRSAVQRLLTQASATTPVLSYTELSTAQQIDSVGVLQGTAAVGA